MENRASSLALALQNSEITCKRDLNFVPRVFVNCSLKVMHNCAIKVIRTLLIVALLLQLEPRLSSPNRFLKLV